MDWMKFQPQRTRMKRIIQPITPLLWNPTTPPKHIANDVIEAAAALREFDATALAGSCGGAARSSAGYAWYRRGG